MHILSVIRYMFYRLPMAVPPEVVRSVLLLQSVSKLWLPPALQGSLKTSRMEGVGRWVGSHKTSRAHQFTDQEGCALTATNIKGKNRRRRSLSMAAEKLTRPRRSCSLWEQWCTPLATRRPSTGVYWQVGSNTPFIVSIWPAFR